MILKCAKAKKKKMIKAVASLFLFLSIFTFSESKSSLPLPEPHRSFQVNATENEGSCSYTVKIKTSCSSTRYTRDQISLAFGDAYGNQVYAPRLDDPYSRTFESCSTDTYTIYGPCTYQVCYLYLYRSGYDGWKPDTVTVYGYYTKSVTFYYNTWIPNNIWYGFNHCNGGSAASTSAM
ncbi:Embryo-specific [Melia azedarach]|uniref:Embryo-specific n=1 Tax=Melia azedarach TaxID=155640 RepID=A0ACC1Y607_MELAZ|nr:Embryo-specific [Melia azedarach]